MGAEIFHNLKSVLKKMGHSTNVGDEGGFAPNLKSNEEAVKVILEAIDKAGYKPGEDVFIALDPASSEYFIPEENVYHLKWSTGDKLTPAQMVDFWADWAKKYPIISIEDGMAEDDWAGWKLMTDKMGDKIQLVGDDRNRMSPFSNVRYTRTPRKRPSTASSRSARAALMMANAGRTFAMSSRSPGSLAPWPAPRG